MATFPGFQPDYGVDVSITPRLARQKFGDGYEQVVGDGLNTMPRVWGVTFTQTEADIDTIESFLHTCGGVEAFDWTPPRGAAGKWRTSAEGWKRTVTNFGYETLTASFEEVFFP